MQKLSYMVNITAYSHLYGYSNMMMKFVSYDNIDIKVHYNSNFITYLYF